MPNPLTPSQEAREAAEDAYYTCFEEEPGRSWLDALLAGKHDNDPVVQAFARFEQAIRKDEAEKCAVVADEHATHAWDIAVLAGQNHAVAGGRNHAGREIAAAIRARHAETEIGE